MSKPSVEVIEPLPLPRIPKNASPSSSTSAAASTATNATNTFSPYSSLYGGGQQVANYTSALTTVRYIFTVLSVITVIATASVAAVNMAMFIPFQRDMLNRMRAAETILRAQNGAPDTVFIDGNFVPFSTYTPWTTEMTNALLSFRNTQNGVNSNVMRDIQIMDVDLISLHACCNKTANQTQWLENYMLSLTWLTTFNATLLENRLYALEHPYLGTTATTTTTTTKASTTTIPLATTTPAAWYNLTLIESRLDALENFNVTCAYDCGLFNATYLENRLDILESLNPSQFNGTLLEQRVFYLETFHNDYHLEQYFQYPPCNCNLTSLENRIHVLENTTTTTSHHHSHHYPFSNTTHLLEIRLSTLEILHGEDVSNLVQLDQRVATLENVTTPHTSCECNTTSLMIELALLTDRIYLLENVPTTAASLITTTTVPLTTTQTTTTTVPLTTTTTIPLTTTPAATTTPPVTTTPAAVCNCPPFDPTSLDMRITVLEGVAGFNDTSILMRITVLETLSIIFESRVDGIEITLGGLQTTVSVHETRLNIIDVLLSSFNATLNVHADLLNSYSLTLSSHTTTLASHTSTLASHTSTINLHTATLSAQASTLASHTTSINLLSNNINNLNATLIVHETRLNGIDVVNAYLNSLIVSHSLRMDGHDSVLNVLNSTTATQTTRLNGIDVTLASQTTRLNGIDVTLASHTTRLNNHDVTLGLHSLRMDGHDSVLAALNSTTSSHTIRLNAIDVLNVNYTTSLALHGSRLDVIEARGIGVTSVSLSVPSAEFTLTGSSVTAAGTLSFSKASQLANYFWAGPTSGGAGVSSFRAIVSADIPISTLDHNAMNNYAANRHIDHSAVSILSGTGLIGGGDLTTTRTIALANTSVIPGTFGSASQAVSLTVDAQGRITSLSQITASIGVSSIGLSLPSDLFSVSGSPVTSSGSITVTAAAQLPNTIWCGPASGGSGTPSFRALVTADIPQVVSLSTYVAASVTVLSGFSPGSASVYATITGMTVNPAPGTFLASFSTTVQAATGITWRFCVLVDGVEQVACRRYIGLATLVFPVTIVNCQCIITTTGAAVVTAAALRPAIGAIDVYERTLVLLRIS